MVGKRGFVQAKLAESSPVNKCDNPSVVGKRGFEPPTSRTLSERSIQAEPLPDYMQCSILR